MKRVLRWMGLAILGLAALGIVTATAVLRWKRSASGDVEVTAPGIRHVRNFMADVYAAPVGSDVILFDAGMDPEGHAIDDMLTALHATREDVKHVFLTHGHFDHVAAAGLYRRAQIHAGRGDVAVMAHRENAKPMTPRLFAALIGSSAIEPNSPLDKRQRIEVGGGKSVLVVPFPGHTPGSFLFLFDGVLFTGDSILLEGGRLTHAIPANSVDLAQNKLSIRSLGGLLENERVDYVCTGHMWCTAPGMAQELLRRLVQETL